MRLQGDVLLDPTILNPAPLAAGVTTTGLMSLFALIRCAVVALRIVARLLWRVAATFGPLVVVGVLAGAGWILAAGAVTAGSGTDRGLQVEVHHPPSHGTRISVTGGSSDRSHTSFVPCMNVSSNHASRFEPAALRVEMPPLGYAPCGFPGRE